MCIRDRINKMKVHLHNVDVMLINLARHSVTLERELNERRR